MKPLAGAVTSDVAASVRISAIFALAETGREGAIAGISSALVDRDRVVRATAEKVLADLGAEIIPLENGGKLVRQGDEMRAIAVGVSTARVSEPPHNPVFRIHGAGGTRYLRTGVGDIYVNGSWLQSPPVEIPYQHDRDVQNLVHRVLPTYLVDVPNQNPHSGTALLAWPGNEFRSQLGTDRITVAPVSPSDSVPAGVCPTSTTPPTPTPPLGRPADARSSGRGHRALGCTPGRSGGPRLVVQLAIPVGLDPVLQHAIQTFLSVPPFGAVHRTLGHVQSGRHLGRVPSLSYFK